MGFFFGFLLGSRGPSDAFWRNLFLMLAWGLPLAFGKFIAVNASAAFYVPASLAAYAAMIAFTLWRPATSSLKLALMDGAIMWARLVSMVFAVGAVWRLSDVGFVLWRVERGLWRDVAYCAVAVAFEVAMRWWIRRDVVLRNIVFDR